MPPETSHVTLRDLLAPIRERWLLIVGIVVLAAAAAGGYAATKSQSYTASTEVYFGAQAGSAAAPVAVANEAVLLTSEETAAIVARRIGYRGSPAALAASVTATPASTTSFITITATEASATLAARVANAFAREFISQSASSATATLSQQIAALRQQRRLLRGPSNLPERQTVVSQIQQLQLQQSQALSGGARQVDVATGASASGSRSVATYAGLAAVAALLVGLLLAVGLRRLDPHLKTVTEASSLYDHPVLATVPHDPHIDFFADGAPGLSARSIEAFRELRVGLDVAAAGEPFATILVTSAGAGEGKSTVARNLAVALAQGGSRTAVIDADLRRASLPGRLGVDPGPGVTDVVAGLASLELAGQEIEIAALPVPGSAGPPDPTAVQPSANGVAAAFITLIRAGAAHPNPSIVLESPGFHALLKDVASSHDVVVIDSAPLTAVSDTIPMMGHVSAILLVARNSVTDRRSAARAAELIGRIPGARVVGVVVNDVPAAEAAAYGLGYGYGYEYTRSA